MEKHIDTQKIREYLQGICSDETFAKSKRYTHLLTFLVEQAIAGKMLKEHIIGMELFEQNYNEDKNDGIVRVYMYNLRKKLKTYYTGAGINDEIVFALEKGSYNLKFNLNTNTTEQVIDAKPINRTTKKIAISLVIAFVIVAMVCFYFAFSKPDNYCWDAFFDKDATNTCILADQVILNKKGGDSGDVLILSEVNSSSDFIAYTEKNNVDTLELADYTFFTKAIPYSLHNLSRWFCIHSQDFSPIPESEFRYEETKRSNIIYLGQYKTMSVSKEVFLRNSKVFKANYNNFEYLKDGKITQYKASFEKSLRAEYAMVSYMSLSNGNKALYFVSNNDIGTMATINKFTDPEFLEQFYKEIPSSEAYFNALFKVEGIGRADVSCELVALEVIEK